MHPGASRPLTLAVLSLLLAACAGCGSGAGPRAAETVPVKGRVTYRGRPLTKGIVQFEPRNRGRVATGRIQADGTFVLGTAKEDDGAVEDVHRVSISETGGKSPAGKPLREVVPLKYAEPNTSGLQAKVSKDTPEFTFDLK